MSYEDTLGLAERALDALSRSVDEAAVLVSSRVERQVRFSRNEVDVVKTWIETEVSVQISIDQRVAVLSTSSISEGALEAFMKRAVELCRRGPRREPYARLPEGPFSYPIVEGAYDHRLEEPGERLPEIATEAIESALSEGARRVAGAVRASAGAECLVTTAGVRVWERFSKIYAEARAFLDELTTGHSAMASRSLDGVDGSTIGSEAGSLAKAGERRERLDPGRYPAVFGWSGMTTLLGVLGSMASAMRVLAQMSPYVGKLGEEVAEEKFTLVDNPLGARNYGARSFDLEGLPTRRVEIIEGGVLRTYLHNRFTAKAFGTESTGHAGWVFPSPWHLELSPGDLSKEELLEELNPGVLVNNVTYLRFQNYRTGDFSAIIRDGVFLVRRGEIVGGVRGLRLSDNVLRMLKSVRAIGREARQVYHWWAEWGPAVTTPMVAFDEVGFTAATV